MEEFSRIELIEYVNHLTLQNLEAISKSAFLSTIVINPWDKRVVFSDGMMSLLGQSAGEEMLLEAYYQFIPENNRRSVIAEYENSISMLLQDECPSIVIKHSLTKDLIYINDVEIHAQLIMIGKTRFIVGYVFNVTSDISKKSFSQFFGEGMNSYLCTYDMVEDTCYLSDRFVVEFDLRSNVLRNFKSEYKKYLHTDDKDKISEAFHQFLEMHLVDPDLEIRLLAPGRGELHLKIEGFSDSGSDGKLGGEHRYISAILSDVTSYVQEDHLNSSLLDGTSAVKFNIDISARKLYLSENIHEIVPDIPLCLDGDYVELIAARLVKEDRSRFRSSINYVINNIGQKFQTEVRLMLDNNRVIWIACRGKSIEDRITHKKLIVGLVFDLTRMNEVKETVERHNATHNLTGLPTREKLASDAELTIRNRNTLSAALILVDVNEFHSLNDRYGVKAGDLVLEELARLLRTNLPEGAKLYHIGVDIFAILWSDSTHNKADAFMNDIYEYSRKPFNTEMGEFFVTFAISAAFYPTGNTFDELMTNAEIALHKVKQDKKLKYSIYSPVDMRELKERVDFEFQITQSLRNNMENFQLYYQPLIDAQTGKLLGAEALLRWQTSDGELVNPEKVVSALESTAQMEAVGSWILNEAIKQVAKWRSKGAPDDFYVHINATSDDLIRKDYVDDVKATLDRYNVPPENILIELTETSLTKNMAICRKNIRLLSEAGIRTALDDFGSGYSSFNYLKELPVNEIKIDKTFVDDMDTVEFNRTFISAMTMLAHSIGKGVVVEGIETEYQASLIRDMGADVFQGYLFDKPMSVFAFWNKYFA